LDASTDSILRRVEDGVSIISFNRPRKHNAMDNAMSAAFAKAVADSLADESARVILLRAEGKSFCAGRDLASLGQRLAGVSDFAHVTRSQKRKFELLESQKPVIAAMKGHAVGGGFEIALHADLRVAGDSARMSLPEIDYGIITDGGGSTITASLAGASRAKYLLMTGDAIDARQALVWGLVDFVVPDAELDASALGLAKRIAAKPPVHLAVAKQLVDGVDGERVKRGIREELLAISFLYRTADRQEAFDAFLKKRKPKYTGL
jgi:enoyl-CoA hydratase/carnithine racemase